MKTVQLTLALVLVLPVAALSNAQETNPQCAGLSGAAYGQCTAAVSVQCDGITTQPAGCEKIQERFSIITGQPAPWVLNPAGTCPCYTVESLTAHIDDILTSGRNVVWDYDIGPAPWGDSLSLGFRNEVGFGLYAQIAKLANPPGSAGHYGQCSILDYTVPFDETQVVFSSAEADACWSILAYVAKKLNLPQQNLL